MTPITEDPDHKCLIDVSVCCKADEHKWFPLMCSSCGEFPDFGWRDCGVILYKLD